MVAALLPRLLEEQSISGNEDDPRRGGEENPQVRISQVRRRGQDGPNGRIGQLEAPHRVVTRRNVAICLLSDADRLR
jgi:hypothetical protein